ncbi:hypothetical protein ANN_00905 [Periplaneta americana]|uniref:Uncharacterized protein n=1 Tax=Periplaneta americana TaxID=6978 RepID=A0ABQ8TW46_PERAM|nr:hypothetical protein ANN_00905 [Periplaneta americana]
MVGLCEGGNATPGSLQATGNEFQSLGRAIVKEDEYEEVRWDGIVSIVSWRERVFRLWWEERDLHQISEASSYVDDPEEFVSATYSTSLHSSEKGKEKNLQAFHGNLTEKKKKFKATKGGIAPIEIDCQLCQVYGPNIMSKQMVRCSTRSSVMMVGLPTAPRRAHFGVLLKIVYSSDAPSACS